MAEEQLNLIDGMSPSLRRIYLEAERLNKKMLSLRSSIKALEKPASISYLRRELKSIENQAKQTETALKRAVKVGEKEGVLSWNPRYRGIQHHMIYGQKQYIKDADLIRYGNYIREGGLRRQRLIQDSAGHFNRYVNGLSFEQRVAARRNLGFSDTSLNSNTSLLSSSFIKLAVTAGILVSTFNQLTDVANRLFVQAGDEYLGATTRVALTSDRTSTPTQLMDKLYDTAIRTRADAHGTISLYNRIAMSGVKASNDRILRFVETFNKTMAISGTTAQENRAVMLQLAQGMGSNRLGGDEFRSIAEQAPMFKWMLAEGLGVNPGALKQMGADGKLTADAIMTAMERVQGMVDEIFLKAPWTVGQLLIILQDKWQQAVTKQITGYVELRNVLRDLVNWLDTEEGTKFLRNVIDGINYAISVVVDLARALAPIFKFIGNNLKFILQLVKMLGAVWVSTLWFKPIGGIVNGFKLITMSGTAMWQALTAGAVTFGATCAAILGWISLIVVAMWGAWQLGQRISEHIQAQEDKAAVGVNEVYLAQQKNQAWNEYVRAQMTKQGLTPYNNPVLNRINSEESSDWNKSSYYWQRYKKWENDVWAPVEAKIRSGNEDFQRTTKTGKHAETEEEKLQKQLNEINNSVKAFEGAMDSSKNIPMPVESRGGRINSIGRIEDDVNLNTDSIQMMKALAERQWIVQNEVVVPQKVDMFVDKSTSIDPESLAENLNQSIRLAAASSMRGEAVA